MTKQTTHANDVRDGESALEIETKVPESVDTKDALEQLVKAAKRLAKRHVVNPD